MYPSSVVSLVYLHGSHVVLGLQGDFEHFSPVDHPLHAGCGDGLTGDAVDLVERMRLQRPLISRPDEDLQAQWSCALVSQKLAGETHFEWVPHIDLLD